MFCCCWLRSTTRVERMRLSLGAVHCVVTPAIAGTPLTGEAPTEKGPKIDDLDPDVGRTVPDLIERPLQASTGRVLVGHSQTSTSWRWDWLTMTSDSLRPVM